MWLPAKLCTVECLMSKSQLKGYKALELLVSLSHTYVETICDAQAGFWLNSKFWSKMSGKPLSGISDQKAPPPFWTTSDLRWPKFTLEYPPILENFRFEMTKVYSRIPPPISENFKFEMTKVYSGIPPHFRKLQIWDDQSLFRNTPPPFRKTSDLKWPNFTLEYPPPISENAVDRMWRLICNPQGYHSLADCLTV